MQERLRLVQGPARPDAKEGSQPSAAVHSLASLSPMDVRTQTALLASIVATALGLSMVLRPQHARVVTAYSLFAFSTGGFYLFTFLESVCLSNGLLGWPERISLGAKLLAGILVPSAALGFFLEFLRGEAPGGGGAGAWPS